MEISDCPIVACVNFDSFAMLSFNESAEHRPRHFPSVFNTARNGGYVSTSAGVTMDSSARRRQYGAIRTWNSVK
ncbi:hypothetical protein RRG08_057188 [Elysia crispata]|uniref:Uncharacterized protein n=1 Tax=Elysia crispata TaxID=231223 RepID=A0AAE0XWW4_9GAST|nr:hypothetical protein RRG08_057188 [Elysia crispata]